MSPSLLGWQGRLPETSILATQKPRDWSKKANLLRSSGDLLKIVGEVEPTLPCSEAFLLVSSVGQLSVSYLNIGHAHPRSPSSGFQPPAPVSLCWGFSPATRAR